MPGIFGFVLCQPRVDAERIAQKLSEDLCLFDWQQSKWFTGNQESVYLGTAWNDLEPAARGASFYSTPEVTCVLDGYISRVREECNAGSALARCCYAEAAVKAYEKFGDNFIGRLEGPFSLVIYDKQKNVMLGATDRHGLTPLYRYEGPEGVFFCSILGPMAKSGLFPAEINEEAAATHLGYDHLFYRQSLIKNVVLQDPACTAVSEDGNSECCVKKYWNYGNGSSRDSTPYKQKIDDLCDTLLASTNRILGLPGRLFTSLSGGLDSRLMTGLAIREGANLEAWTFGDSEAADMIIASRICKTYKIPHHIYEGDPLAVLENASIYSTILNGSGPLQNAYGLPRCHDLRGKTDRILNGYRGGVVLGNAIVDLGQKARLRYWKGQFGLGGKSISPNLEDAQSLKQMSAFYRSLLPAAKRRVAEWTAASKPMLLADLFKEALTGPLADTPDGYKIEQWTEEFGGGRHFTLVSIFADRHFYSDSSIFYDYDVRDRCFAIDPSDRRGNKAYVNVMNRLMPDLASETYANSGVPANYYGTRLLVAKGFHRLRNRNRRSSTGLSTPGWLLIPEIKDFCSEVIKSKSFQSRSFWNGAKISEDFELAVSGSTEMLSELWNAITLELFVRQWLDVTK